MSCVHSKSLGREGSLCKHAGSVDMDSEICKYWNTGRQSMQIKIDREKAKGCEVKCIRCGADQGNKICQVCMRRFCDRRAHIMNIVENEIGKLCLDNHAEYIKRVKAYEKKFKKEIKESEGENDK